MSGNNKITAIVVAALALPAGACSAYTEHSNTVARSAGDAIDANVAIQTIDPWPYASSKTEIMADGRRVNRATERYVADETAAASDSAAQATTAPAAGE
jgi:hypothetical protein